MASRTSLFVLFVLAVTAVPAFAQMSVPATLDVNSTGAAVYTIPIAVPPGTAGMQPKLSLEYNSNADNGLLGVGWSLAGLPAITRCRQNYAQDGTIVGIQYGANDRFCIDGERLVAISGAYGADGTEYRTEHEGFSKVISHGVAGTGPAYFEVRTKSGQIMEFGNTSTSRIEVAGSQTARLWMVNKVSDTVGNYMTVTYAKDSVAGGTGEYRPTEIDYTGNGSIPAYASVQFVYEARSDVVPIFQAGVAVKTTQRLSKIQTFVGTDKVSEYQLSYDAGSATKRSRITSVQLCAGPTAASCLPPTTFDWQKVAAGTAPTFTNATGPQWDGEGPIALGDFNGDGRTDLIIGANVYLANEQGQLVQNAAWTLPSNYPATSSSYIVGDWNGDGRSDIVFIASDENTTSWYVYGTDNGFSANTPLPNGLTYMQPVVLDVNGDGRSDLFMARQLKPAVCDPDNGCAKRQPTGMSILFVANAQGQLVVQDYYSDDPNQNDLKFSQTSGRYMAAEWNGDGAADLGIWTPAFQFFVDEDLHEGPPELDTFRTSHCICSYAADGYHFDSSTQVSYPGDEWAHVEFGDFNGDGLTDVLRISTDVHLMLSKGDGTLFDTGASTPTWGLFGDWNSDGKLDLAIPGTSTNFVYSTGAGFDTSVASSLNLSGMTGFTGDFNGDGCTDILAVPASIGPTTIHLASCTPERITGITTGLGSTTTIAYAPLTNSTVYTKDSGHTYPEIDTQGPMYVVSQVEADAGPSQPVYRTTYTYAGGRMNLLGRGFLGFHQVTATDEQTSIQQVTEYRQDYPFVGMIASITKTHLSPNGNVELSTITNTYAPPVNLGGTRNFVFLQQSLQSGNDLDGSPLPATQTHYQYDTADTPFYGNVTTVQVETGHLDGTGAFVSDGFSKTTNNTYTNDAVNWHLGRLTGASVTSTTPTP
jgi:hypothetical protein